MGEEITINAELYCDEIEKIEKAYADLITAVGDLSAQIHETYGFAVEGAIDEEYRDTSLDNIRCISRFEYNLGEDYVIFSEFKNKE